MQTQKKIFSTELAYLLGILTIALGAACMTRADFGLSMVVAPAYIFHLKLSQALPFFSFGMAEYCLQAVLLLLMVAVLRKFRISYIFSFFTAVLYGLALDMFLALLGLLPVPGMVQRILFYLAGLIFCALGVSLVFHTYIAPEVYELLVKEVAGKYGWNINKVKTAYDCISCVVSVLLSFAFFGLWHFEGVKLGTLICAPINGWMIGRCTRLMEKRWEFKDTWNLRRFFI